MSSADLDALLDSVGLAAASTRGCASCRVASSSGSQSPALLPGSELVILDEPTASLDRVNAQVLVDVLARVASQGATMVITPRTTPW